MFFVLSHSLKQQIYLKLLLETNAGFFDRLTEIEASITKNRLDIEKCIVDLQNLEGCLPAKTAKDPSAEESIQETIKSSEF